MDILEELMEDAVKCGFSHVGPLDVSTIVLRKEARDAYAENKCGRYGVNWSCPPGCGTLEECEQMIRKYHRGILVQTTGDIDTFNYESYLEVGRRHNGLFDEFARIVRKKVPGALLAGAAACSNCESCTYPDAPCRFPDRLSYPMEGLGMIVSQVCRDNGLKYHYGSGTITYIACVLID